MCDKFFVTDVTSVETVLVKDSLLKVEKHCSKKTIAAVKEVERKGALTLL